MNLKPGQTILWEKVSAKECRLIIEPPAVIKPDPVGALNFASEHRLPQRRSDEVLAELRGLVTNLSRVTTKLERDPGDFLFGGTRQGVDVQ